MDFKEFKGFIDNAISEQNNQPIPDFEGYSPNEMSKVLRFTFESGSPLGLQKLSEADYKKIPILNQVKYLADLIAKSGELKLTQKGFLPPKIVSELYGQRFLKEEGIDSGITKLYKEADSITVNLTRILCELSGLVKKRKGKLSLTKSADKLLVDDESLLRKTLHTFTNKFNWAYYDGYGDNGIAQFGYGFSLILLSKYGNKERLESFYAEKYFKAYPQLIESVRPMYGTKESCASTCYSLRLFDRFLLYFGLISIEKVRGDVYLINKVKKTELFDRLITLQPHRKV